MCTCTVRVDLLERKLEHFEAMIDEIVRSHMETKVCRVKPQPADLPLLLKVVS